MDFVTSLPVSTDWKSDNYNSILVIINCLTKIVHYKLDKAIIHAPSFTKVIINMVM